MTDRWVLVANASEASLYVDDARGDLHLVRRHEHPQSREKNIDLTTDINGRKPGGGRGADGRPGAEPQTQPKEVEHQRFARLLATDLERGRVDHAYAKLVLCAPPHFLGLLRNSLDKQTLGQVECSLDKDLTHLDERHVAQAVQSALRN